MILDERLEFADALAATGTGVNQILASSDVIDSGNFTKDLGDGCPIYLVIQVDTLFSGGTSVEFQFRSSTLAALTGGTTTTHYTTGAITVGTLVAGYTIAVALPLGTYQRYAGIWHVTVGNVTAGKVNCFLTKDVARWRAYADASN